MELPSAELVIVTVPQTKFCGNLGDMIPYNNIYGYEFEIHEHK